MRRFALFFAFCSMLALFALSCSSEDELAYGRYFANGKILYEVHCQNCHNADGKGLGLLIPPLTDTLFLKENKNKLACIIRYGLNKEIKIHNKAYKENMPADDQLSNIDIAQITVFVTNSFGNNQGYYSVLKANADLENCK